MKVYRKMDEYIISDVDIPDTDLEIVDFDLEARILGEFNSKKLILINKGIRIYESKNYFFYEGYFFRKYIAELKTNLAQSQFPMSYNNLEKAA